MRRLLRPRNAIIAATGAVTIALLPTLPAAAAATSFGAQNCYSYAVMLWATTSNSTLHLHESASYSLQPYYFTDGSTPTYHLTAPFTAVRSQVVDTTGALIGPGRGCDY